MQINFYDEKTCKLKKPKKTTFPVRIDTAKASYEITEENGFLTIRTNTGILMVIPTVSNVIRVAAVDHWTLREKLQETVL